MKSKGKVKWFNRDKGYGLIEQDNGGEDVIVRSSNVQGGGSLDEGQRVEYEVHGGAKGLMASDVQPL